MTTVEDLYSSVPIIQCAKCGPGSVITLKLVMAVLAALQVIIMSHVWFYVVGPTDVCGEYMWKAPQVCKMDQKLAAIVYSSGQEKRCSLCLVMNPSLAKQTILQLSAQ